VTPALSPVRLDLHNHTSFSADGGLSPGELLSEARARGLDCIAVTDHNSVRGALSALRLSEADPSLPRVIPGIEVFTRDGEIIGLYVSENIPKGTPLQEAVDGIRLQGGLVYLPHPYDAFRRGAVSREARDSAARSADVIEVANGRALGPRAGAKSGRLAALYGKSRGAGSDAHHKREVGRSYVVVSELPTRETLVGLLLAGTVENKLRFLGYVLNWGGQASAPLTRIWRKVTGTLSKE
jgi:predicted metal-dependent phosphoesterase TrpH